MKQAYVEKCLGPKRLALIAILDGIVSEYMDAGYTLTLRQLYYQCIARDIFGDDWVDEAYNRKNGLARDTKNTQKNYKRLGDLLSDARMAGLIDWDGIEDRGRNLNQNSAWSTPADIIRSAYQSYHIDLWEGQPVRPEVWIEKESLISVAERVCQELDVPYYATKGYNSQSEAREAGRRMISYINRGETPVIIHLGDHDPSGIDMTRDNQRRLSIFAEEEIEVIRIALNYDQVRQYNPPPNPAKATDARFEGYAAEYGYESWELDALDPITINQLIRDAILPLRDDDIYQERVALKEKQKSQLATLSRYWAEVETFMEQEL